MAFSFEPFLAIPAGHIMAVSAGPEHRHFFRTVPFSPIPFFACVCYNHSGEVVAVHVQLQLSENQAP
jgi:hypothetical protein